MNNLLNAWGVLNNLVIVMKWLQALARATEGLIIVPVILLFQYLWVSYACSVVIIEGDPHPGAIKGRMSFQSFNPSIDVSISPWTSANISNNYSSSVFWVLFSSCQSISRQKLNEEALKPPQPDISRQKLNEEASKPRQPAVPATSSGTESGRASFRWVIGHFKGPHLSSLIFLRN